MKKLSLLAAGVAFMSAAAIAQTEPQKSPAPKTTEKSAAHAQHEKKATKEAKGGKKMEKKSEKMEEKQK